jgi:tripartite-type tricarboxylate transporter receptor subunit TctC
MTAFSRSRLFSAPQQRRLRKSYPSRPITMIVPFPAGGATDVLARIIAERMRASLGQHTGWSIAAVSSD